jgi:PilZ domain
MVQSSIDVRQCPRYPIQIPVLHKPKNPAPNSAGVGWTRNLSEGGACVELGQRLRPPMPLRVRLQTDRGPIELEAQVTWAEESDSPRGGILHGVAFTQTSPDQLSALQELLLSKALVRHPKVRLPFEVPVTCQPVGNDGLAVQGRTRDGSRGGLLLRLSRVVPPETVLEVTLHVPAGPLTIKGAVAWVAPPEGRDPGGPILHGIRFIHSTWSTAVALGLLLTEQG